MTAAAAIVLAGALTGCSPAHQTAHSTASTPVTPSAIAPSVAEPSQPQAPPPTGANAWPTKFCLVTMPPSWTDALRVGTYPNSAREQRGVQFIADDGSLLIENYVPGKVHELRWLPAGASKGIVVQRFSPNDDMTQEMGASFDGRYLAYSLLRTNTSFDDWTLYVWDAKSRAAPRKVAQSGYDRAGNPLPGPFIYPLVYRGVITWPQATGVNNEVEIRTFDIKSGHFGEVPTETNHPGGPFRWNDWLVWPESPTSGAYTVLHAVDYVTHKPVTLPSVVANIVGASYIATSGDMIAWSDADQRQILVWRSSWPAPVQVASSPTGYPIQWVNIAGPIIAWDDGERMWALDLRTGASTHLTDEAGFESVGGPFLQVNEQSQKLAHDQIKLGGESIVDTRKLPPLGHC